MFFHEEISFKIWGKYGKSPNSRVEFPAFGMSGFFREATLLPMGSG